MWFLKRKWPTNYIVIDHPYKNEWKDRLRRIEIYEEGDYHEFILSRTCGFGHDTNIFKMSLADKLYEKIMEYSFGSSMLDKDLYKNILGDVNFCSLYKHKDLEFLFFSDKYTGKPSIYKMAFIGWIK